MQYSVRAAVIVNSEMRVIAEPFELESAIAGNALIPMSR
jgi:hypothetical protein